MPSAVKGDRGFNVVHQKVSVDVDIAGHSLVGWVELTIVPTTAELRSIVLDARQITISQAQINGKEASFEHTDLIGHPESRPTSWGVHQYNLYKEKIGSLFRTTAPGELVVKIPSDVVIFDQDTSSTFIVSHTAQEKSYEPLTVRVNFVSDGATAGLNFVGGTDTDVDLANWHAYTTHVPFGQATSCWMPCVDGFTGPCTWELEFGVPKTLRSLASQVRKRSKSTVGPSMSINGGSGRTGIGAPSLNEPESANAPAVNANDTEVNALPLPAVENTSNDSEVEAETGIEDRNIAEDEDEEEESDDPDLDREVIVICNNNAPSEVAHPTDPSKKVVSFEMFTPIFAQHVGFAIGPFGQVLMSSEAEDEQGTASTSGISFSVFALPSSISMVANTCGIFSKAMEFFTRDFGSFPFSSYSICFVGDFPFQSADAAALTLCSDKLLFPADVIEPIFAATEPLIRCLAAQWCGVNIVAQSNEDIWITEGVSHYMTHLFVRKLMGNNEYRFRMRQYADEIVRQDVGRAPLADPQLQLPIFPDDLEFTRLKAPMVLYILDRRMTKTDRSLGLSRVIPKLLLQSMSGDLNAQINTAHFIKICEKVAHHRLDKFFEEWVYMSGYPIFRITQRFNKKRMFVEMGIGQVQSRELPADDLKEDRFLERAVQELLRQKQNEPVEVPSVFTGPMTIRIHEADGTPYEHVVFLKDSFTKLDIQYNTKYKRLKRNQKFRSSNGDGGDDDKNGGGLIHCMGDVLMRDADADSWKLSDWGQDEEEYMFNEAFEWIRVDSDFEWIGKMFLGQPDYMYASQLQQDRDVVAQFEAVTYFGNQQPNPIYSSILTRTLMDNRYFYNVRVHAALGLVSHAVKQLDYLGEFHLMRVFQKLFCFEDSFIPRANDFSDFSTYFVQKAIPTALSYVRDESGQCPATVRQFLLGLVRYNENSGNQYSDSYYMSALMTALVTSLRPLTSDASPVDLSEPEAQQYVTDVVAEIDKCQRIDLWLPSHNYVVSLTGIQQDELLLRAGYGRPRLDKLLLTTAQSNPPEVRLAAFQSVLDLGGYENEATLEYFFHTMLDDHSRYIRLGLLRVLRKFIGMFAIHGKYLSPESHPNSATNLMQERQIAIARRAVDTAIPVLRSTLGEVVPLQRQIWKAMGSKKLTSLDLRLLFDICEVLYSPKMSFVVSLAPPKVYQLSAKRRRDYLMVIRYRNVLKRQKSEAPEITELEVKEETEPPKLKLKLGLKLS